MIVLLSVSKLLLFVVMFCVLVPANVYGHGLGIDTISSVNVQGKNISISVELPMYFDNAEEQQLTVTAIEKGSRENAQNVTFLIGLFHEDKMIFRNYFFAEDGHLPIKIKSTGGGDVAISGQQDSLLGAWHTTESQPIEITGPVFESGGLYSFEIEVRTIDEPTNIIEDSEVYYADLSIVETTNYIEKDAKNQDVEFKLKSYFDTISRFEYDSDAKTVTFEMPFDWSEKQMSHIPVIHEEVHFPKDFTEFLSPSYVGTVNGIELFKSSISVDDYTEEDERIVHFVLLQDHLRHLKNQMKQSGEELPENMAFTLSTSQNTQFPLSAFTSSEDFEINLSWDPLEIQPEQTTKFVFTIRDGQTGVPLRNSEYTFVIIQNGKEIYRTTGNAQVGGDFEEYAFSEDQTGPTIVRFENIRNSGQGTEFGFVVAPEFGALTLMILVGAISAIVVMTRKYSFGLKGY